MHCPKCGSEDTKVIESRDAGSAIRRRRECLACANRFTTYERVERPTIAVAKRDGRKVLFDRQKLYTAIQRSVGKFLTSEAEIDNIVSAVEDRIYSLGESEVNSKQIGDFVLDELANRNEVAYVALPVFTVNSKVPMNSSRFWTSCVIVEVTERNKVGLCV